MTNETPRNKASFIVESYKFVNSPSVTQSSSSSQVYHRQQSEKNSFARNEIEKIIMDVNNLQDDLIEKFYGNSDKTDESVRGVWDLQRRFSIITSSLRRLKSEFIPGIYHDELKMEELRKTKSS